MSARNGFKNDLAKTSVVETGKSLSTADRDAALAANACPSVDWARAPRGMSRHMETQPTVNFTPLGEAARSAPPMPFNQRKSLP